MDVVFDREASKALLKEIKAILGSRELLERKFPEHNECEQDEMSNVDRLSYCDNDEFNWCFLGDPIVGIVRKDDFDKEIVRHEYPHEIKLDKKAKVAEQHGCKLIYSGQAEPQIFPCINGITGRKHVRVYECGNNVIITVHKDTPIPHRQDPQGTIEELRRICNSEIGQFLAKQGIWTACTYWRDHISGRRVPHDRLG